MELDKLKDDLSVLESFEENFGSLIHLNNKNLKPITKELINKLVEAKVVPDEKERRKSFSEEDQVSSKLKNSISKLFPKKRKTLAPKVFSKSTSETDTTESTSDVENVETSQVNNEELIREILWQSSALTQRDLNIPKGENTNPTGSMLFKKGKAKDIDQRHFFRDEIFNGLDWKEDEKRSHIERTESDFKLIINNQEVGIFKLKLSHNKNVNSKSYKQKNSMTNISWGKAKEYIANPDLIGKELKLLYDGDIFILKID